MSEAVPGEKLVGSEDYRALIAERRRSLRQQIDSFIPENAQLVWELGSGHGHFLTAYARAHPEKLCAGVDIVSERVERAARKQARARLVNLRFFQAEARLFLHALPDGVRLSEVFVLFPDPWPKLRHHKHRIMQSAFLDMVAARAAPECRVFFRTDYAPYFEAVATIVRTHPLWVPSEEAWPFEFETVFQSRAPRFQSLIARLRP